MSNRIGKLFLKREPSVMMRNLSRDSFYSTLLEERFLCNDVEQFRGALTHRYRTTGFYLWDT